MHCAATSLPWNIPQSTLTPLLLPKTKMKSSSSFPTPPLHCSLHKYHFHTPDGERFHRHLKTGLKARLVGSNWVDDLPIVLLGILVTLNVPQHEWYVAGHSVRRPGGFFSTPSIELPSSLVSRLRSSRQHLQFVPTGWHGRRAVYPPPNLHTATRMNVRCDSHKPPLTRLYDGPFRVLRCFDKYFTLDINGEVQINRSSPL